MNIEPFATEEFFAQYEFTTPYLLCTSDCESMSVSDLLALAEMSPASLHQVHLGYSESMGDARLRQVIARTYETVDIGEVTVLAAPEEGIYLTMRALLAPGDHVVVVTPAYDSLRHLAAHVGAAVTAWPLQATEDGWELDVEGLKGLLRPETKLVIINFPHNPTGFLPTRAELERIVAIVREAGVWLFSDEMYRLLEFDEAERLPAVVDLYERGIVLAGLSKAHGLPGLRAGWLVVKDGGLRARLRGWKHYTTICAAAPSEWLAWIAIQHQERLLARNRAIVLENLTYADSFFERWGEMFTWRRPRAGSVALVGIEVASATVYCGELAEAAGVLLLPGPVLGADDKSVRFGFGRHNFLEALSHYESFLRGE
ncbi:MAG TPA: aminotransferase class I/II-fold pyridoxal phosphate-dependent enzyme [Anaerolineae bacterium]|nr:aminotransferase class I/II-fold pyridoxal phosphate-dependent enzyme [Anaerolineae bacterium]